MIGQVGTEAERDWSGGDRGGGSGRTLCRGGFLLSVGRIPCRDCRPGSPESAFALPFLLIQFCHTACVSLHSHAYPRFLHSSPISAFSNRAQPRREGVRACGVRFLVQMSEVGSCARAMVA